MAGFSTDVNYQPGSLTSPMAYTMPSQLVSWKEKQGKEWQENTMKFFYTMWTLNDPIRRKKKKNYELMNNILDVNDYNYILDKEAKEFGIEKESIKHYNICSLPLKNLWSTEASRPFKYFCKATDEDSVNLFKNTHMNMLKQYATGKIQQGVNQYKQQLLQDKSKELQSQGIPKQEIDKQMQQYQQDLEQKGDPFINMEMSDIQDIMKKKFVNPAEKFGNYLLKKLIKDQRIEDKFVEGFKDATISGEEVYWTGVVNGKAIAICCDPSNIVTDQAQSAEFIDQSEWVIHGEYMLPQQIVNDYSRDLTFNDLSTIEALYNRTGSNSRNGNDGIQTLTPYMPEFSMLPQQGNKYQMPLDPNFLTLPGAGSSSNFSYNSRGHILVLHCEWFSKRKMAELTFLDQDGMPQLDIVDGEYKLTKDQKDAGWSIEYFYIDEPWQGTRIGDDIFVDIKPKDNDYVSPGKLYWKRLGFTGKTYNKRGYYTSSILDDMKPWQILYNWNMKKLEEYFNTDLGQILLMDITQIPTKFGFTKEKWLYYAKKQHIAFIDPVNSESHFNQFSMMQTSMAQSIQATINTLEYIERKVMEFAGVSPQRMGQTTPSETATGVNTALQQSYIQTEIYHRIHAQVKERVLQNLLEDARRSDDAKDSLMFNDDLTNEFISSNQQSFADLDVYITDSIRDQKMLETLRSFAPEMVKAGNLLAAATVTTSDNVSDIMDKIYDIDEQMKQNEQAQMQQKQDEMAQKLQMYQQERQDKIDEAERQRNWESEENTLKLQNTVYLKMLDVEAAASLKAGEDLNNNAVPDFIETGKLALDNLKFSHDQLKHNNELSLKGKEISLKAKDLSLKEKQHKDNIQIEKDNMKNDLQIAKINSRNRSKSE